MTTISIDKLPADLQAQARAQLAEQDRVVRRDTSPGLLDSFRRRGKVLPVARPWQKQTEAPAKVEPVRKTAAAMPTLSKLEQRLRDAMDEAGITGYTMQYLFIKAKRRRYAWDFAFVEAKLLIEVQGGTWSAGRSGHSTGTGIRRDCMKANAAVLAGWRLLVFTSDMVRDGGAVEAIRAALKTRT